jgi:hypothetical protein
VGTLGGPVAGALQQHHQRHLGPQGQLGQPVALRVAAGADGASQRREVLGADHDRPAVDATRARHDAVGRDVGAHQGAELTERAGVEQVVDPGPRVELAAAAVLGQPFLAAHRPGGGPPRGEIGERRFPVVRHSIVCLRLCLRLRLGPPA